jgi:hypothetical protein
LVNPVSSLGAGPKVLRENIWQDLRYGHWHELGANRSRKKRGFGIFCGRWLVCWTGNLLPRDKESNQRNEFAIHDVTHLAWVEARPSCSKVWHFRERVSWRVVPQDFNRMLIPLIRGGCFGNESQ